MAVETTAPFRRVVGTLIRGVADGLLGGAQGIPLAGAQVTATASVKSAASGEFIVLDPVDGTTDQNARLRNASTGEDGILLLVTDDPSIGVIGWTWHITVTAPSLNRPGQPPRTVEFDIDVPSGEGDLDLATLVPVPGNVGEDVILWRAAVEQTAANLEASEAIVATSVDDARLNGANLEFIRRDGTIIVVGDVRGPEGRSAYEQALTLGFVGTFEEWIDSLRGQDGSNVLPDDEAVAQAIESGAATGQVFAYAMGNDFLSAAALGVDQTGEGDATASLQAALNRACAEGKRLKTAGLIRITFPIVPRSGMFWDGASATTVFATNFMSSAVGSPTSDLEDLNIVGVEFVGGRKVSAWTPEELPRRQTTTETPEYNPSFTTAISLKGDLHPTGGPRIDRVNIDNCYIHHTSGLPTVFQGVRNPSVTNTLYRWTLDPGFTFCKNPVFSDNRTEFGSDNGVSLSRGCTNVQCHNNVFEDIGYWGMWFGGWDGDPGPTGINATGNTIRRVGRGFIFLGDGPQDAVICGNRGTQALNGPIGTPSNNMGVAMQVSGIAGGRPAKNILIIANQFSDCYRGGVHLLDVENVTIGSNQFLNMGTNSGAASTSQTHNNAIFIDRISSSDPVLTSPRDHAKNVTVFTNFFLDDRSTVLTNSAWTNDVAQSAGFREYGNVTPVALRNMIGTTTWLGGAVVGSSGSTNVFVNGPASAIRDFSFMSNAVRRWDMRVSGSETGGNAGADFQITRRDDAGNSLGVPFLLRRSDGFVRLGESAGRMGFFGSSGATRPSVPGASVDTTTDRALLNALRAAMVSLGLVT